MSEPGRHDRAGTPTPDRPAPDQPPPDDGRHRVAMVAVSAGFLATLGAGAGLLIVYLLGGDPRSEGVMLAIALGGFGAGLVIWSHYLMPAPIREEERHPMASSAEMRAALSRELLHGGAIGRRRALAWLLVAGVAGLGAVLLAPLLSLGPSPGNSLMQTAWARGRRLVDVDGRPVVADEIPEGGLVTVFPEGSAGRADSQAVLIHVDPATLEMTGDALSWAPIGFVAYSKLCTHAGCPVGLFLAQSRHLTCPCHQSTFDVLRGARPTYGPAARPLPQLPMRLEADGTFTALGDFPEPVGASFWDMSA